MIHHFLKIIFITIYRWVNWYSNKTFFIFGSNEILRYTLWYLSLIMSINLSTLFFVCLSIFNFQLKEIYCSIGVFISYLIATYFCSYYYERNLHLRKAALVEKLNTPQIVLTISYITASIFLLRIVLVKS